MDWSGDTPGRHWRVWNDDRTQPLGDYSRVCIEGVMAVAEEGPAGGGVLRIEGPARLVELGSAALILPA